MSPHVRAALALLAAPALALRAQHKKGNSSSAGYVVTLGDSYSSGTGIHKHVSDYHQGDECCRDFKTTPGAQLASFEGMRHIIPACAGDQIPQVQDQFTAMQADYPEEAARGWENSVITLTIGGNDIRSNAGQSWPEILTSCIIGFYDNCHTEDGNQVANFDEVQAQLAAFYTRLAQGASKATIRIWGYPRLLQRTWQCIPVPGVNAAATRWMDDMVDELNGHIAAAVASVKSSFPEVDVEFVPVTDYLNKGACSTSGNHVHAIVLSGLGLSPMTFHPSQKGYNGFYDSLANSLGRSTPPSQVPPGSPEPWNIERIFSGWDQEDGDGKLSIREVLDMGGEDADPLVSKALRKCFSDADVDKDEYLSLEEFEAFLSFVDAAAP